MRASDLARALGMLVFAVSLSACGIVGGIVRDSITQVQIQRPGFRIIKRGLTASATVEWALCSILVSKSESPHSDLMEELHEKAQLGPNQTFVNLREDERFIFYLGLYCKRTYTLSADVIEFTTSPLAAADENTFRAAEHASSATEEVAPVAPAEMAPQTPSTSPAPVPHEAPVKKPLPGVGTPCKTTADCPAGLSCDTAAKVCLFM